MPSIIDAYSAARITGETAATSPIGFGHQRCFRSAWSFFGVAINSAAYIVTYR